MPEITIGASPRNSSTNEGGMRFYTWRGQKLVSVTTVRRMAGIPFGLHNWAIGQVVDAAVDSVHEYSRRLIAAATDADEAAELVAIKKELRRAATAERDRAAALGTAVHDAAATGQRLDLVAPELRPRLAQFYDFLAVSGIEVVATEFQVWNPTVGYGGTVDLLGRHRNGTLRVIDLKTGKGIYNAHALQVTAYDRAEFAGNDDTINEPLTALLAQTAAPAILHLADDGWGYIVLKPDEQLGAWRAFRGLMVFSMWTYDHADPATFTAAKREGKADPGVWTQRSDGAWAFDVVAAAAQETPEVAPMPAAATEPAPGPSDAATAALEQAAADLRAAGVAAVADPVSDVIWLEPGPVIEATAEEIAAVERALIPPTVPRTEWCVDFLGHQSAHRQLATDDWQCDLCVAILPLDGPSATDIELGREAEAQQPDNSLSRDEFKGMCRVAGIEPPFLVGVARELWPAVANLQTLTDEQRGTLYEIAFNRWTARGATA